MRGERTELDPVVEEQQRLIAEWMRSVMAERGLSPTRWALDAGLARDTVSRVLRQGYKHTTSTTTIVKLARAANVPVPIDLGIIGHAPALPGDEVLVEVFRELLRWLVPEREFPPQALRAVAQGFRIVLGTLSDEPAAARDPSQARLVARTVRQTLPPPTED